VAEPPHPSPRLAGQTPALESKHAQPDAPPSRSSKVSADKPPRLLNGHVEVSTTSTLARLGEALSGRSLSEFEPEVEKPVRPASSLALDYPPAALEAQREGSVLAWVHVATDGSVKEVEIVEGEPEFADSVRDSLMKARFLPAEVDGHAVENYIILQFDFRIGAGRAPAPSGDLGLRPLP
jgi:TonB family protein